VFNFCFVDVTIGKPVPNVSPPPVCPLILECTANDASTYQFNTPDELLPRMRGNGRLEVINEMLEFLPVVDIGTSNSSCKKGNGHGCVRSCTFDHIQCLCHNIVKGS
jgi:hypothetical protein